jgi:hypothetical protein
MYRADEAIDAIHSVVDSGTDDLGFGENGLDVGEGRFDVGELLIEGVEDMKEMVNTAFDLRCEHDALLKVDHFADEMSVKPQEQADNQLVESSVELCCSRAMRGWQREDGKCGGQASEVLVHKPIPSNR